MAAVPFLVDVSEEQVRRKQKEAANYGGSIEAASAACDLLPQGQEIIAAEFHTRSELNQPCLEATIVNAVMIPAHGELVIIKRGDWEGAVQICLLGNPLLPNGVGALVGARDRTFFVYLRLE